MRKIFLILSYTISVYAMEKNEKASSISQILQLNDATVHSTFLYEYPNFCIDSEAELILSENYTQAQENTIFNLVGLITSHNRLRLEYSCKPKEVFRYDTSFVIGRNDCIIDGPNCNGTIIVGKTNKGLQDSCNYFLLNITNKWSSFDKIGLYVSKAENGKVVAVAVAKNKNKCAFVCTSDVGQVIKIFNSDDLNYSENIVRYSMKLIDFPYQKSLKKICFLTAETLLGLSEAGKLFTLGIPDGQDMTIGEQKIKDNNGEFINVLDVAVDPCNSTRIAMLLEDGKLIHGNCKTRKYSVIVPKVTSTKLTYYDRIIRCIVQGNDALHDKFQYAVRSFEYVPYKAEDSKYLIEDKKLLEDKKLPLKNS